MGVVELELDPGQPGLRVFINPHRKVVRESRGNVKCEKT